MAAGDGFTIEIPAVLSIAATLNGLTSSGSHAAGALGLAVLDPISFATIGSEVASVNSTLQSQLSTALGQLLQLLGQTNSKVSTAATGYADLDAQIAALLGGGSGAATGATATSDGVYDRLRTARTPAEVRTQWDSLTADQQRQLITDHPQQIGAMNGVPAIARDQANRSVLASLQQQTKHELAEAKSDLGSAWDHGDLFSMVPAQARVDAATKQLSTMQHLQTVLGNGSTQQYLLGVDTNGPGHWIVASGNPDTAQHVVTLVPGMNTPFSADQVDGQAAHSATLLQAAHNAAPNDSTSVITWAGYDSPQGILQAVQTHYAANGAAPLQSFQQGLYASHDGSAFTTMVAAHSYGTVVATDAALAPGGLRTDALAYLDSPGVPAANAASLGIPHVFATATSYDPVVHISDIVGQAGANEYNAEAAQFNGHLIPNPQDMAYHGTDPVSASFGATRFDAGTGTPGLLSFLHMTAHSDVFNPAYPGPANLGQIATGHYSAITAPK
ncbi:MAG: alpha/beta hydrolase [Jatrophihabitans sp.]